MACVLTVDPMVGTRSSVTTPPFRVVAQGGATCNHVNVVFDAPVTPSGPAAPDGRSFLNVPVVGGRWTLDFPPVASLACGSRPKLTVTCVEDTSCTLSTTTVLDCIVLASQCPQVVLATAVVDPCDSTGRSPVTLEASFTDVAAGTSVYWDFGDGNSSAPHAVATPNDVWTLTPPHFYSPGSYVATLKSFSPYGCSDYTIPVEVAACAPKCPTVQLKVANLGDCDDHARRLVTIGATVQNAAPGTELQLDYGDGNFSEVRPVTGNQAVTFNPHPFLPPGPYMVKSIVVSPGGCPSSVPLEVRNLRSCDAGGGSPTTDGGNQDDGTYPPRAPRPWYCAWLEAIWMLGFILFLVLSLVTLCVGLAGAQALAQVVVTGALFWLWLGVLAVSIELLVSFTLTALGIAVIALFLWISLCHPSRCRILGDFCWVLFWSSIICGTLAASVGPLVPPVFLYPLLLGLAYGAVSDYTRAQGCVEPDKYSLPFLR